MRQRVSCRAAARVSGLMSSAATTGLQRGRNRLKGMLGKGSVVAGSCSLKCGKAGHAGLHRGLLELNSRIWLNASARKREVVVEQAITGPKALLPVGLLLQVLDAQELGQEGADGVGGLHVEGNGAFARG